jgi:hypothetical protein
MKVDLAPYAESERTAYGCAASAFVGQVANLPLEFLHFSGGSSVNQGLIGDLETERSE